MIMITTMITSSPSHYNSNDNNDNKDNNTITTTTTTTANYSGSSYQQYVVLEYEDKFPPISPVFPFLNEIFFKN